MPIKVYSKKRKMEDVLQNASNALVDLAEQLKKDPVADLLTFFQKENENARAYELQLFSIMFGNQSQKTLCNNHTTVSHNGIMQPHSIVTKTCKRAHFHIKILYKTRCSTTIIILTLIEHFDLKLFQFPNKTRTLKVAERMTMSIKIYNVTTIKDNIL